MTGREQEYVNQALESGWINHGPFIERFEEELAYLHNVEHAVTCSSGTAALHLALLAMGVGEGDKVVVPSLTCVMTANAARYCGAEVSIGDINYDDWTLFTNDHNANVKIPVHLYGSRSVTNYPVSVVVDAAQAFGMEDILGDAEIATLSFSGNKTITTGQGGACLTNNKSIAQRMRFFRQQAQYQEGDYWHTEVGYNYRMTNVAAAIGLGQIENYDEIKALKGDIHNYYIKRLCNNVGFQAISGVPWVTAIRVPDAMHVIKALEKKDIETRPSFFPLHMLPMYDGVCPMAKILYKQIVVLPSHPSLTEQELELICDTLLSAL